MTRSTNTPTPIRIRFHVKNRRQPWGAWVRRLGAVVRRGCSFTSLLPSVRSGPSCWMGSRVSAPDRAGADSAPKYGEAAQPGAHPPFPEAEIYRVDISGVTLARKIQRLPEAALSALRARPPVNREEVGAREPSLSTARARRPGVAPRLPDARLRAAQATQRHPRSLPRPVLRHALPAPA